MGKAKVSTAALGSVAKVIVGSVDSEPHEHIMKRYYYGEREFFSGVSSITCALDGIRVGKTEYLFVVLAGRHSNGDIRAACAPPQDCRFLFLVGAWRKLLEKRWNVQHA